MLIESAGDMPIDRLGPINQWETYKQAMDTDKDIIMFSPDPQKELEARASLQNPQIPTDLPEQNKALVESSKSTKETEVIK